MSVWAWWNDVVYAGGGARHERPMKRGVLHLDESGLVVEPDDDFYSGTVAPKEAIELARAILAKFGESASKTPPTSTEQKPGAGEG